MALLSKINIGGTIYDIKDAYAREEIKKLIQDIEGLGTAAGLDYADAVADNNSLPTGSAIVKYVGDQIADINAFDEKYEQ